MGQLSRKEDCERTSRQRKRSSGSSAFAGSCSAHSGDWLLVPPITAVGLRMMNKTIRIATGMRLGITICEPHLCPCGKQVESRGFTVYHVATVLRRSVSTAWSTTSFGEQCRGSKFQQQWNHQVYYEVTTSVQTLSRLYREAR